MHQVGRLFIAYLAASGIAALSVLGLAHLISLGLGTPLVSFNDSPFIVIVWLVLGLAYTLPCGLLGIAILRLAKQTSILAYGLLGVTLALLSLAVVGPFDFALYNVFLVPFAFAGGAAAITFRLIVVPSPTGGLQSAPLTVPQHRFVALLAAGLVSTIWAVCVNRIQWMLLNREQRASARQFFEDLTLSMPWSALVLFVLALGLTLLFGLFGLGLLRLTRQESYLAYALVGFLVAYAGLAILLRAYLGGAVSFPEIGLFAVGGSLAAVTYKHLGPGRHVRAGSGTAAAV